MSYIVCGWYTPDYAHWLPPLVASLAAVGAPHDFVQVEKAAGGWEKNTLRKASVAADAMQRHKGRTVILLDVDAVVHGSLEPIATTDADVALHFVLKRKLNGNNAIFARSGTLVLRPTWKARTFVDTWQQVSESAPHGWVDQSTLLVALWRTPGLNIAQLDVRYCATRKDDVASPVVLHGQGSCAHRKLPPWLRALKGSLRAKT